MDLFFDESIVDFNTDQLEWSNSPAGEILDYRQQKRQQFNLFKKTSGTKVSGENITMNDRSPNEIKHT